MATIRDIARVTNVSCTTVSNVIHGKDNRVSAATIKKINDAIKELGYIPNMSARSLVSNSSKVIGFVNHTITIKKANFMEDPFHSTSIGAIEQALRENGYYLMLRTIETAEELLTFLRTWNVDGLFFTGIFQDHFFDVLSSLNTPIVLIDSYANHSAFCNVGLTDFEGSYDITKYLIDHGHKRIAFASPSIKDGGVLQERFLGYKAALTEHQIPFEKSLVFVQEMDIDSCRLVSRDICAHPDITAVVASADVMAAGIMAGLQELGKKIPEDISIVGFDDISLCQMVSPPLTTVHQDIGLKGRLATELMLQLLDGKKVPDTHPVLPTRLVERQSVRFISE